MDKNTKEFPPNFIRMVWVQADPFVGPNYTVGALVATPNRVIFIAAPTLPGPEIVGGPVAALMRAIIPVLQNETDAKTPKRISLSVAYGEPMAFNPPRELTPEDIDAFVTRMWTRAKT